MEMDDFDDFKIILWLILFLLFGIVIITCRRVPDEVIITENGLAFEQIEILKQTGADPSAFIWVHAQRGTFNNSSDIFDDLLPALRNKGFTNDDIDQILVKKPGQGICNQDQKIVNQQYIQPPSLQTA